MPALANPKHERFAQLLAKGQTATEAYIEAGYTPNDGNAARLKGNERIRDRVHELQSRVADDIVITAQWVIEQLVDNAQKAKMQGDFGPSNQALQLLGKELGMFVDRTENVNLNHDVSAEPLTEDEWQQQHATSH